MTALLMKIPTALVSLLRSILIGGLFLPLLSIAAEVPAWLLLSPDHEDSVMTIAAVEKDSLVKSGWQVESAGAVQNESTKDSALLHRLIRNGTQGTVRMLESDPAALAKWKQAGYVEEGVLGHVAAAPGEGRIAVVQFSKDERRLWLVRQVSQEEAIKRGWVRQGVQFWLWPKTGS